MKTIKECFEVILGGDKDESFKAARLVRKLLYNSKTKNKYEDIKNLINDSESNYNKISEDWRQENFVQAISVIYFLHDREADPDFLFPLLFKLLEHSNGIIRYAAVRMFSNELGPLTVFIRVPDFDPGELTHIKPKQADDILFGLFVSLNLLLERTWEPKYKKYKYVSSLPASPFKSVQMVIARMQELCGEEYINNLEKKCRNNYSLW